MSKEKQIFDLIYGLPDLGWKKGDLESISFEDYIRKSTFGDDEVKEIVQKIRIIEESERFLERQKLEKKEKGESEYYDLEREKDEFQGDFGELDEEELILDDFDLEQLKEKYQKDYDMASVVFKWLNGKVITMEFYEKIVKFFKPGIDSHNDCGWFANSVLIDGMVVCSYVDMLMIEMCNDYCENSSIFIVQ